MLLPSIGYTLMAAVCPESSERLNAASDAVEQIANRTGMQGRLACRAWHQSEPQRALASWPALLATSLTACLWVQVPMTGYFAWSLLTNWEWAVGYTEQFGVVDVNFKTEERTLKASANYLASLFAGAGANTTSLGQYD